MNSVADQIRDMLTIPQVLNNYGYPTSRQKRIPCPLHGGRKLNFCYTDHVFHCWVCGSHGDLIGLVMQLFNLPFKAAVMKLNADFNLGLTARKPTYRERQMMEEDRKVKEAAKRLKAEKSKEYDRIAVYHREVFKQLCKKPEDDFLIDLEKRLEQWLDENMEEVITPWSQ